MLKQTTTHHWQKESLANVITITTTLSKLLLILQFCACFVCTSGFAKHCTVSVFILKVLKRRKLQSSSSSVTISLSIPMFLLCVMKMITLCMVRRGEPMKGEEMTGEERRGEYRSRLRRRALLQRRSQDERRKWEERTTITPAAHTSSLYANKMTIWPQYPVL